MTAHSPALGECEITRSRSPACVNDEETPASASSAVERSGLSRHGLPTTRESYATAPRSPPLRWSD